MGRMMCGALLLALMLAFAATAAGPALGHGAGLHVAASVHQITPPDAAGPGSGDAWAGVAGYTLVVGMIFTLIALVGLRACGRPTAHPDARRRQRL